MIRLRNLLRRSSRARRNSKLSSPNAGRSQAEVLEDRSLLSAITVTSADDTVAIDGQVTLREAIAAANNDISVDGSVAGSGADEIRFDPSLANSVISLNSELVVSSNLIIDGDELNITLDGQQTNRHIRLNPNQTLLVSGLGLTNGSNLGADADPLNQISASDGSGGSILSNGGFLTLRDTTVWQNEAVGGSDAVGGEAGDGFGGAIASLGGSVTLANVVLTSNDAAGGSASVAADTGDGFGGGLFTRNSIVTITGSTIDGNTAGASVSASGLVGGDGFGGGVSLISSQLTLQSSTVSRNDADFGGGIYRNVGSSGLATINASNITISSNTADNGGGIFQADTGVTSIAFGTIFGNDATGTGGGLFNRGLFRIGNSILSGNTAVNNPNVYDPNTANGFESTGYNLFGDVTGTTVNGDVSTIQTNVVAATIIDTNLLNNGGNTETHTLVAGSPALDAGLAAASPVEDQRGTARPATDTPDIGSVEISETEGMDLAAALDASLDLRTNGNLYENWGGLGEKWVTSPSGHWYYILPSGAVHQWDGTAGAASGTLIANLPPVIHTAPDLLYNATAADIDEQLGLHGTGNLFENWGGLGEKWMLDANDDWHFILPNGELYKWDESPNATGTLIGQFETKFHTNPNLLFDATNIYHDRWYNFSAGSSDFFNFGGRNEKWFRGGNGNHYFILPGGSVILWDGTGGSATGTFIVSTDAATYTTPSSLYDAFDNVFADWVGP